MSKSGGVSLVVSGISFLAALIVRTILGSWIDFLWVLLGVGGACFLFGLIKDRLFYKEFLTMRTTKHGMNMGVLILLTIVMLVAVNFMSVRHSHKWDWTTEGLNSISLQSIMAVDQLEEELKITFFYRSGVKGIEQARGMFKELTAMYKDENPKVIVRFSDVVKEPGLAQKYGVQKAAASVFVDYKGKRNSVEQINEEGLTTAILKVSRIESKKVYFLIGHGEKDSAVDDPTGLSDFRRDLEDSGRVVETLNLLDKQSVPEDADMLAILGPKTALLPSELDAVNSYLLKGGKVLIAGDPGERHNLARITKTVGIEYKNEYVLDQFGQLIGSSAAMALGREYPGHEVTKKFDASMMTMFYLASSLVVAPDKDSGLKVDPVVRTGDTSFATNEISNGRVEVDKSRRGPYTVVMASIGKLKDDQGKEGQEYSAVVFGDSDVFSNQFLAQQMNRDLALNSVSSLLKESNLVSIRPKKPKGTTLTMSRTQFYIMLFGIFLPLPVILFGAGGFHWYRRRTA